MLNRNFNMQYVTFIYPIIIKILLIFVFVDVISSHNNNTNITQNVQQTRTIIVELLSLLIICKLIIKPQNIFGILICLFGIISFYLNKHQNWKLTLFCSIMLYLFMLSK